MLPISHWIEYVEENNFPGETCREYFTEQEGTKLTLPRGYYGFQNVEGLQDRVLKCKQLERPKAFSHFLRGMLTIDPLKRKSAQEMLEYDVTLSFFLNQNEC
jgi:hypothetical protein